MLNDDVKYYKSKEIIKKYLPIAALILLTLFLMIFFRHNKRDIKRLIEQGKNNLVSFYAQNLRPLFAQTEISNEDIFNFALYQSLPIDKGNNKILLVSNEESGNQIYEIKPGVFNSKTNNYERFINYLNLNKEQKDRADSILNTYKKDINLSVLMNDENTVAVSPKLAALQRAVLADLISYAQKINSAKTNELFPSHYDLYDNEDISNYILSAKEIPQNEYIFITPDTVFQTVRKVNTQQPERYISDIEKNKILALKEWKDFKFHFELKNDGIKEFREKAIASVNHYEVKLDSNIFKIILPLQDIADVPMISSNMRIELEKVAEKLRKLTIKFNSQGKSFNKLPKIQNPPPEVENPLLFEININDQLEIANKALEVLSSGKNEKDWTKFGIKMDSIARTFGLNVKDSVMKRNKALIEATKAKHRTKSKSTDTSKDTLK